jgi:hypothetical protein
MTRACWWAAAAAAGLALGGCASFTDTWDAWRGDAAVTPPALAPGATDVFYAGHEDLALHELPSGASKVVARLALYQRVTRVNLGRGYTQVRTDSGLEGWVDTADLLWRLPFTPAPAVAGEAAVPPVPATATAVPAAAPIPATPAVLTPELPSPVATAPLAASPIPAAAPPAQGAPLAETPVDAAAPSTPTAAPQPTPTGWNWRNLFPPLR